MQFSSLIFRRSLVGAGLALCVAGSAQAGSLEALSSELQAVSKKATPAVVNISSIRFARRSSYESLLFQDPFFRHFFGLGGPQAAPERAQRGLGSGVIVGPEGIILTNNHVIAGADEVEVTLADRRTFKAKLLGADPRSDLAVLKIDAKNLPHFPLGDSDAIGVGAIVLAIGNPFDLGHTVTMGIVSAKGRANVGIVEYEDFIQTDAAINPGNSGGALVNLKGELIGINTAIVSRSGGYQGIGFAIPSNMVRTLMDSILKRGRVVRGYFGVQIQNVTPNIAKALGLKEVQGVLIRHVDSDSPAEEAGLRRGDVVTHFQDKLLNSSGDMRNRIVMTEPQKNVSLRILRQGKAKTLQAQIGSHPMQRVPWAGRSRKRAPPSAEFSANLGAFLKGTPLEGIQDLAPLKPALSRQLGMPPRTRGVLIQDLIPGSRAALSGLRVGDAILEINDQLIRKLADLKRSLKKLSSGPALILVQRGPAAVYIAVE